MNRTIWIVAGEASGDTRAAEVMQAVRSLDPAIEFMGAGGPKMQAFAKEPFDNWVAEAGVLGLWDVVKNYGYFRRKFHRMLAAIKKTEPDAVLLVDYPGFNLRLAKALRKQSVDCKILYYISPQVWAWNRGRIPKMAQVLDLMLCIFPFEKTLYEASGLTTQFVGHPLIEQLERHSVPIERDPLLVGLFPGSREREIRRIFPPMLDAAKRIRKSRPEIRFEAAAASAPHADWLREQAALQGLAVNINVGEANQLMRHAGVGIVCSGTATLEAACHGMPYCLVYKIAWLTFAVGRHLVKVPHLGIINILARKTVVREFIQEDASGPALADEMLRLLNSSTAREQLQEDLATIIATLDGHGATERAARAVISALK